MRVIVPTTLRSDMRLDLRSKSSEQILGCFESLELDSNDILECEVLESDIDSIGYKSFVDLAQLFFMKMLTPNTNKDGSVILRFKKLDQDSSFHKEVDSLEKYGAESEFFKIDKNSQFSFLYHYQKALEFIGLRDKKRILNLGVNKGDEFRVIKDMLTQDEFNSKELVGIDYSKTAISYAQDSFDDSNIEFISHDINALNGLSIGKFDLIISIGTLQSSNINFNERFMDIYQNYLQKDGTMILGFPNCRWIDSEMIYGAKAPNYSFSELSLVLKDIHFCKKYLQQKKYRVTITGKDYLFLTARKIK